MPNNIEKVTLKNGLQVHFYEDDTKHSTYVCLVTHFGGMDTDFYLDEKPYHIPNGIAHMIEHLLIEKSPYQNLLHTFGEMQLSCNGATYTYHTRYYFEGVEKIEEALTILLHGIEEPCFTASDVEEVKPAIYEEIRRGNDNKWKQLDGLKNKAFFQNIPFISTLGTLQDVESITYEMVKQTYEAFYRPSNQILLVAGCYNKEKILAKIEDIFEEIPVSEKSFHKKEYQEPQTVKEKVLEKKMPVAEDLICLCYKIASDAYAPKEQVKLTYYFNYFMMMNFGLTSPFYQEAIEEKLITEPLYHELYKMDAYLCLEIGGYTKNSDRLMEKIKQQMEHPLFDEELFDMYKKNDKVEIAIRPESLAAIGEPYLENLLLYQYGNLDTVEDIENFSFSEFTKTMQEIDFSHHVICKIVPEETEV